MAIKDLISPGIGFEPGGIGFIVTRGLTFGAVAEITNYTVQAGQFYSAGARMGQVVPMSSSGDAFSPGSIEGDAK